MKIIFLTVNAKNSPFIHHASLIVVNLTALKSIRELMSRGEIFSDKDLLEVDAKDLSSSSASSVAGKFKLLPIRARILFEPLVRQIYSCRCAIHVRRCHCDSAWHGDKAVRWYR